MMIDIHERIYDCKDATSPYPEPVVYQWQSSVPETLNPMYTGMPLEKELLAASSVLLMVFQWLSSGLPVCSNYAN